MTKATEQQQWQYLVVRPITSPGSKQNTYTVGGTVPACEPDLDAVLFDLGQAGWELAGVDGGVYVFKRPYFAEDTSDVTDSIH